MRNNHKKAFYQISCQEILVLFSTHVTRGLSSDQVKQRHQRYGFNVLPEPEKTTWLNAFLHQCKSPFLYVLVCAAFLKFIWEGYHDAIIILIIIFINICVGAIQEGRANRILLNVKKFLKASCIVIRNDTKEIVNVHDVVPGDIIILQAGVRVPADARLLQVADLMVDESILTGQSRGVLKNSALITQEQTPLSDQRNMVFMNTHILSGWGTAVVVAIGNATEIGKLSRLATQDAHEILLKKDLDFLAFLFLALSVLVAGIILLAGIVRGYALSQMLFTLTSLFVSIVPENLAIIFTMVLAAGVYRMARSHVLLKNLPTIESLGRIQVLIVDKTGTLTRNEQMVVEVSVEGFRYTVTGKGYLPEGEVFYEGKKINPSELPTSLMRCARAAALFDHAEVRYKKDKKSFVIIGEPLQAALGAFAQKLGFNGDELHKEYVLVSETPFTAVNRIGSYTYKHHGKLSLLEVGSPEKIIELCSHGAFDESIHKAFESMLKKGLRIVALAQDKNFLGLIGIQDTLRQDVAQTIQEVKSAGLKIVMATGDHPETASYIGRLTGIFDPDQDSLVVGSEFHTLEDAALNEKLTRATVLARVTPEDKLNIISAYHRLGKIVGMTGDGVNDAPALVAADVGIAMGSIGSEIAQDTADIVLLDDSLKSIVVGITEGRHIIASLRRVMLFLLVESVSEAALIGLSVVFGLPLPILALQILWQHLLTDSFLGIGLSMESIEHKLKSFYDRPLVLIDRTLFKKMIVAAIPMIIGTLSIFLYYYTWNIELARTMVVVTFSFFQWFNAWNLRSEEGSVFSMNPLNNLWLGLFILISFFLQLVIITVPAFREPFHFVELSLHQWLLAAAVGFSIIVVEEIRKVFNKKSEA